MNDSQDLEPEKYPHVYLVTAARFLGYHFNPVSFWYLYSKDKRLEAMILEVNNTFDERRMYYLPREELPPERQIPGSESGVAGAPLNGIDDSSVDGKSPAAAAKLTHSWPKDFHVSPFNSRKGSYSLLANDPLSPGMEGACHVDATVNLKSSKGHAKIVARLFSDGLALDPTAMSAFEKIKFLFAWWWVGFLTFPRIAKEAGVLFFRRKLHVWYRPEPLKDSIGRRAEASERQLEGVFRAYLRSLADQSTFNLVVKYVPSGVDDAATELMESPSAKRQPKRVEELEFKVVTPAFYPRFVHYAHDLEAIFCELTDNCTIWVSRPDLLPKLFLKKPLPPLKTTNVMDFVYFKTVQRLRRRPERIERPLTSAATPTTAQQQQSRARAQDIREFRISSMDGFVLAHGNGQLRREYRSVVSRIFLAERLSLGSLSLLAVEHFMLRACVAWILSFSLGSWIMDLLVGIQT
jgi:hypothetical protein